MFNRTFLFLAFTLQAFTAVNAANDLEKWNSEQGRVARTAMQEKIASTTYRELPNHVDSTYRSTANGGKVLREIETNATVKGSRVGTTINAYKEVDKTSAAKRFAENFAKGLGKDMLKQGVRLTAGGILIDVALDEMLEGVGWIIDEGGKVKKKPDASTPDPASAKCTESNSHCSWSQYWYKEASWDPYSRFPSAYAAAKNAQNISGWKGELTYSDGWWRIDGSVFTAVFQESNPNYSSSSEVPKEEMPIVSNDEMIEKIRDYFENPQSPASKDLLIEQAEKPRGKASIMWSDDPSSEQTIYNDNKNTTDKVLKSDNPVADGLTKDTPKITDGTSGSADSKTETNSDTTVNETTTQNPDGSTTTTGNHTTNNTTNNIFNFKFPPFCDYAAKLCDWLEWTKEEPEKEEKTEEQNINDRGIFDRKFDLDFKLGGECPPNMSWTFSKNKVLVDTFEIDLKWACMFFTAIGYALIFASNCAGIWIMYEAAVRKEIKV